MVANECRNFDRLSSLKGLQMIGAKVGLSTATLTESGCCDLNESHKTHIGVIREYCPGLEKYFLSFEDLDPPALWIALRKSIEIETPPSIEILLDWDLDKEEEIQIELEDESESKARRRVKRRKNEELNDAPTESESVLNAFEKTPPGEIESNFCACKLCLRSSILGEDPLECPSCKHHYHSSCMPQPEIISDEIWKCWHCIRKIMTFGSFLISVGCEGCRQSFWDTSLKSITLSELLPHPGIPLHNVVLICNSCQQRYSKGSKDYCQICFKLYIAECDEMPDTFQQADSDDEENLMVFSLLQYLLISLDSM
jgi:hypothetical protein